MELAIDTSTNMARVAISDKGSVLAEAVWDAGQNHTVELIPHMISLLDKHGAGIREIKAIVVARGPGSFNGLRVGLTTAKGLSFALAIPLVAVSTLEAMAFAHAASGLPICPLIRAGRGEIAAAVFGWQNGNWGRIQAEHITTIRKLCANIPEQTVFCGEIDDEQSAQLEQELGTGRFIISRTVEQERARCLAEIGWQRIAAGNFDDPITIQPLYLRKPSITQPKRRQQHAMSDVWPRGQR